MSVGNRRSAVAVVILLLLLASPLAIGSFGGGVGAAIAPPLRPTADTYVYSAASTTTFGTSPALSASTTQHRAFVRFATRGLVPTGNRLTSAVLRVHVTGAGPAGGGLEVHPAGENWAEGTLTWANQPAWLPAVLATSATPVAGQWITIPLPPSAVRLEGATSLALRYTSAGGAVTVASRESANPPELLLEWSPPSPADPYPASSDSYVNSAASGANYGLASTLSATAAAHRSLLRFDTSGAVPAGSRLVGARLQVFVTGPAPASGGFEVHPGAATWREGTLTWANQPTWNAAVLGTSSRPVPGTWAVIDLPTSAIATGGPTDLAVRYTVSGPGAKIASRETGTPPQLLLDVQAGTDPVVMAAGDIACDPATVPAVQRCAQDRVADLLVQQDPAAILTLGDSQYSDGTYAKFLARFDPSYGRIKNRIHPTSGNHEYADPAGGAKGYFDYFNGVDQFSGPAGDRDKGYYSFDIGQWHLIALNSECALVPGGCAAGSPQLAWLNADLAASTARCTLAYWHRPRFSTGSTHPGYAPMGTIWNNLSAAGVDVVLTGHNHNTEIFTPIGVTPPASSAPVRDPQGIKQFIVGSGGIGHYAFTGAPTRASDGTLATFARDDDTFGALRMILHADSYDWSMVPVAGQQFLNADARTAGLFHGTEQCH